ncbi:hypothetical protein K9M79_08105 [Candidatus Woesearchaeota archaeon]|nr:hypothetical protein [Candidatus Woesearchaeota archaeon]
MLSLFIYVLSILFITYAVLFFMRKQATAEKQKLIDYYGKRLFIILCLWAFCTGLLAILTSMV